MTIARTGRLLLPMVVLAATLPLVGCGKPEAANRLPLSGTVTFDGKPLPRGMIIFEADASRRNSGPQGHAEIKDGKFDTRQSGQGAPTGPLVVRVTGGDGVTPDALTPFGSLLFDEHAVRVEPTAGQTSLDINIPRPQASRRQAYRR